MKKILIIFLICITATLLCAAQRRNASRKVTIKPILVVYKTVGKVELKLHIFEPPDRRTKEPVPAMVFFFGGGWVGGAPTQFYHQCDYLAQKVAASIRKALKRSTQKNNQ